MSIFSHIFSSKITPEVLQKALKKGEFVFYYQPEFDLKTGNILGVEALMRWVDKKRGIVPPNEFIPVLEQSGLISQFTDFLLKQTLEDLRKIHESGLKNVFLAINLSVVQLKQPDIAEKIQNALQGAYINSSFLECEITETKGVDRELLDSDVFKKLQDLNVSISIDDFGTGYSSFDYLRSLNIKKLKIDQDFVREMFDNPKNQTIMASMIQLGHDLGLPVLAEGIETTGQKTWLEEHGCDMGQGYWFSRPLPVDQLLDFLQKKVQNN